MRLCICPVAWHSAVGRSPCWLTGEKERKMAHLLHVGTHHMSSLHFTTPWWRLLSLCFTRLLMTTCSNGGLNHASPIPSKCVFQDWPWFALSLFLGLYLFLQLLPAGWTPIYASSSCYLHTCGALCKIKRYRRVAPSVLSLKMTLYNLPYRYCPNSTTRTRCMCVRVHVSIFTSILLLPY